MKIGNLQFEQGIFLAPMEDVSDYPFRMICRQLGADLVYSEFISSEALIRDAAKAFIKMTIRSEDRPIGIQIYGNRVDSMVRAAQLAEEKNPDFIDINFGCPVKKVALKGAGAGLLRDIPLMIDICSAVVRHTDLPVTAKTRLGWDTDSIVITEVAEKMQDVGIEALAIHARTRSQGYKGKADWTWIKMAKEAVQIPIIGNGDINSPQSAKEMFDTTGCDAIMIGRGAIHNPWIFRQTKAFLQSADPGPDPDLRERIEILKQHYLYNIDYKGPYKGVLEMRKHISGYLKGLPHVSKFRMEIMQLTSCEAVFKKLDEIEDFYTNRCRELPLGVNR